MPKLNKILDTIEDDKDEINNHVTVIEFKEV